MHNHANLLRYDVTSRLDEKELFLLDVLFFTTRLIFIIISGDNFNTCLCTSKLTVGKITNTTTGQGLRTY